MTDNDQASFDIAYLATAEGYGRTLTPTALELYWQDLKHLDRTDFEAALQRHRQDHERGHWFPVPADILGQMSWVKSAAMNAAEPIGPKATGCSKCVSGWIYADNGGVVRCDCKSIDTEKQAPPPIEARPEEPAEVKQLAAAMPAMPEAR